VRALVHHGPGRLLVEDRPEPRAGPGELVLRPSYVGLCVTDRHVYDGTSGRPWPDGLTIGHEFSASVHEVGPEVEGWQVGDRVVVDPRFYCHDCPSCRGGLMTLCRRGARWIGVADGRDGAFADLVVAPAYGCYRIPLGVDDRLAALGEPLASVTRAARLSGLAVDDHVAIVGAEDYGLLMLQRVLDAGAARAVVVDGSTARTQAASELGASATVAVADSTAARLVRETMPEGADLVFVALEDYVEASAEYLRLAFKACRTQGTVVVLRAYGQAPYARIDPEIPLMKEITIRHFGAFFGEEPIRGGRPRGDWSAALGALERGAVRELPGTVIVDFEDLSGPRQVHELMHLLPDEATKVLVRVGAPG
jgi:threonine dehydrogenase-like Zn-dependent dehydrogenase